MTSPVARSILAVAQIHDNEIATLQTQFHALRTEYVRQHEAWYDRLLNLEREIDRARGARQDALEAVAELRREEWTG